MSARRNFFEAVVIASMIGGATESRCRHLGSLCWKFSQLLTWLTPLPLWPALLRPAGRGDLRADGEHLFSLRRTVMPRGFLRVVVGHRGVEALGYQVLTGHFIGIARAR